MQDSRGEEGGQKEDERDLAAALRENMRQSGAMERLTAGVRAGNSFEIEIIFFSNNN